MGYPATRARAGLSPGDNHARKLQHGDTERPNPGDTVSLNPKPKHRLSQEDAHSQMTPRTHP